MRKPIIVGNWKMHKTNKEALAFVKELDTYLENIDTATYGIAAPFTCVGTCAENAKNLIVAAQNVHFEDQGAYTGEVSVLMLEELGLKYCVVGHSERRGMFGETDETVNKKLHRLFQANITPIMCIGETLEQFEANETEKVIRTQLQKGLKDLSAESVAQLVIAYEPIWAIGTGKSATMEIAQNCCAIVRDEVQNLFGSDVAEKVRIQYGGSVKAENIKAYLAQKDIDGALIGGASLKADSFKAIIDESK